MVIDFVESVFINGNPLQGFFSVNANITTPSFSVSGRDIWYGLNDFELFIADLRLMGKEGNGEARIQTSIEAGEDMALFGDDFGISFSIIPRFSKHIKCHLTLGINERDLYINSTSQMLMFSFGIDYSTSANLVAEFENLMNSVVEDLTRRAKGKN